MNANAKRKAKMHKWRLRATGLEDSHELWVVFEGWGRNGVKNGFTSPLLKLSSDMLAQAS